MTLPLALLVLAPLTPAAHLQASAPAPVQAPGDSLESFLERARRERELLHARLGPEIEALLARVATTSSSEARVRELARHGPEATPLLVPHLDPGEQPTVEELRVADHVARALARMQPAPVTAELLAMLERGSPAARVRAARVLAHVPPSRAVTAALRAGYEGDSAELRGTCLQSLLAQGGEGTTELLDDVLRAGDPALVDLALEALHETRDERCAGAVRALLASPRAVLHADGILAYYAVLPRLADADVIQDLTRLTLGSAPRDVKLAVLAALPGLDPRLSALRRRLEPLTESRDRELREAALVVLAALGDRGARRALLVPYDDLVDRNERWSQAYARRADVLRRSGDYDGAIRDYKQALELAADDPKPDRDSHVNLARCYALSGKPREASEWLRRAPISLEELRSLADDPDFASVRSSRYADEAFALEESP